MSTEDTAPAEDLAREDDGSLVGFTPEQLRPRTREEIAAYDARVSALVKAERQAQATTDPDITSLVFKLVERARRATAALACGQGVLAGDVHHAVDLCVAARAARECKMRSAYDCPIEAEERELAAFLKRVEEARIPGIEELRILMRNGWTAPRRNPTAAEIVIGAMPGRRLRGGVPAPITPLWATGPQNAVASWLAGKPTTVDVGAKDKATKEPILETVRGDEWCLLMGGEVGTGRTAAACTAILVGPAWFATAPEVAGDRALEQVARNARLLILDDLGTEVANDGKLAALLSARYADHRRTIVTTNLRFETGPQSILERYGARLHDRFRDGLCLGFRGQSLRGQQALGVG